LTKGVFNVKFTHRIDYPNKERYKSGKAYSTRQVFLYPCCWVSLQHVLYAFFDEGVI
jgi:hypothetical protein